MAFTQNDIDSLDAAIKRGVRTVTTSDGKSVTYASTDEMIRVRRLMQADVAGESRTPSAYSVARVSKAR